MKKQAVRLKKHVKLVMAFLLAISILVFAFTSSVIRANILTLILFAGGVNENSLSNWANAVKSSEIQILKDKGISEANNVPEIMKIYQDSVTEHNSSSLLDLIPITSKSESFETRESYVRVDEEDKNFINQETYRKTSGQDGKYKDWNVEVGIFGKSYKFEKAFREVQEEKIDEIVVTGTRSFEEVEGDLRNQWEEVKLSIQNPVNGAFKYLDANDDELSELFKIENLETKISSSKVKKWTIEIARIPRSNVDGVNYELEKGDSTFDQWYVELENTSCNEIVRVPIVYNTFEQNYQFSNVVVALSSLCERDLNEDFISPDQIEVLTCTDCRHTVVDKYHSLPVGYTPQLINTDLRGGGQLTPVTVIALKEFFEGAKDDGITLEVVSAYRSYETQIQTFNFWVEREISYGKSRADAEISANVYSARPGHSEHQLGTTVDLKDTKCSSFNQKCNKPAYNYIGQNAHKYGFVVSYPPGMQHLTGYKYEPWHIRYIGRDWAMELFERGYLSGSGDYLSKFLLEERQLYVY